MDKPTSIEEAIEQIRNELNLAGDIYGLRSDLVLRKSNELDDLLNEYNKNLIHANAAK